MGEPDRRLAAAADNAAWCDAVCRAHGLRTSVDGRVWRAAARSPDGYPDAVTLLPGLGAAEVLAGVSAGPGCSVKDSFADLDLRPAGFAVLFEATWIRRPIGPTALTSPTGPTGSGPDERGWRPVRDGAALRSWARDVEVDPFPDAMLAEPDLTLWHAPTVGAGFALCARTGVVGVSHAWPGRLDSAALWADVVAVAAAAHPGRDLVGYERDDDLPGPLTAGFDRTGPLRIWLA